MKGKVWSAAILLILFVAGSVCRGAVQPAQTAQAASPVTTLNWATERPDAPHWIDSMGNRSLALDAAGAPHIAYGGDALYYASREGSSWQVEIVDEAPGKRSGSYASLALDAAGRPHISYGAECQDGGSYCGQLRYAHYDGAAWQIETVDSSVKLSSYTSLALDAAGRPRISYSLYADGPYPAQVKYAHYDGASWQIETVDEVGGSAPALVLDTADRPHIAFYTGQYVKYEYFDGVSWQMHYIYSTSGGGVPVPLVLDSVDQPHLAVGDEHFFFDGTNWLSETLPVAGSVASTLVLDQSDHLHFTYRAAGNSGLMYAFNDGTDWVTETVASDQNVGGVSLALDAGGLPHVSYYHSDGYRAPRNLTYAYAGDAAQLAQGNAWQVEAVDEAGLVDGRLSLALDSAGLPHIAYVDLYRGLKYAWHDGSGWRTEVVDSTGTVGFPSLALDGDGHAHISYCLLHPDSSTCDDLRYASYDGFSWHIETVDATGGHYTSLVLDAQGRPHIAYTDNVVMRPRYAYWDGSTWQIQTVGEPDGFASYTSLALDRTGRPHIGYEKYAPPYGSSNFVHTYWDGASWQSDTLPVSAYGTASNLVLDEHDWPRAAFVSGSSPSLLRYGYYDGSSWLFEQVSTGETYDFWNISLALDGTGRPALTYSAPSGLVYAHREETAWITETVPLAGRSYSSLALDTQGRPHIGYTDSVSGDLKYSYDCDPVTGAVASGPAELPAGTEGLYSASAIPISTSVPLLFAWDSGAIGPTTTYSWTAPGIYTVSVTATNGCGEAVGDITVTVVAPPDCEPLVTAAITGPLALGIGQVGLYTATFSPPTATAPLIWSWSNGTNGSHAVYSWTLPSFYTITLTGTNPCGTALATIIVRVLTPPHRVYLPLLVK